MADLAVAQEQMDRDDEVHRLPVDGDGPEERQRGPEWWEAQHVDSEYIKLPVFLRNFNVKETPGETRKEVSVKQAMNSSDLAKLSAPMQSEEEVRQSMYREDVTKRYNEVFRVGRPKKKGAQRETKSFASTFLRAQIDRLRKPSSAALKQTNLIIQQNDRIHKQDHDLEERALAVEAAANKRRQDAANAAGGVRERVYEGRTCKNDFGFAIADNANYKQWIMATRLSAPSPRACPCSRAARPRSPRARVRPTR